MNDELRTEAEQAANDIARTRLMGPSAIPVDMEAIEDLLERVAGDGEGGGYDCEECNDAERALDGLRDAVNANADVMEALTQVLNEVSGTNERDLADKIAAALKGTQ